MAAGEHEGAEELGVDKGRHGRVDHAEPALLSEKQTSQLVVAGVVVSALWQA